MVGVALGLQLLSVELATTGDRHGVTRFEDPDDFDDLDVGAWGAVCWAGLLAEMRAGFTTGPNEGFGDGGAQGALPGSDLDGLFDLVLRSGGGGEEDAESWRDLAERTLAEHWDEVEALASKLEAGDTAGPAGHLVM